MMHLAFSFLKKIVVLVVIDDGDFVLFFSFDRERLVGAAARAKGSLVAHSHVCAS